MLEHYKKTARGIQMVIAVVTLAVLLWSRNWALAGLFFATMQFSAFIGAGWAVRFKRLQERGRLLRGG